MSSLAFLPSVMDMFDANEKIAVLTANVSSLSPMIQELEDGEGVSIER